MTGNAESGAALIWSPFGSAEDARACAEVLLREKLITCANIVPAIESIFHYEGQVQSETEVGVLFKTHPSLLDAATTRLADLHPYYTPAICGWMADSAPPATCEWLAGLVQGDTAR